MNFNDLITRGGEANQQSLETITILQGIFEKPNPTKADFMKVPNGQAMWDRYSKLSSKKSDRLEDKDAVSVKDQDRSMPNKSTSKYYTIKEGDTFIDLERKYKLKRGTLQKLNPDVVATELEINQKIIFPDS